MAQIDKEFSDGQLLALPIWPPLNHLGEATQLYNNEKNATECNKMQQIYE